MNRRNLAFGIVLLVSLALDQGTKHWIYSHLAEGVDEITVIPGFFSLVHRQNPGAAFGMFREFAYRHYVFLAFTLVAAGFIFDMLRRVKPTDAFVGGVLGLILSGAFGNAIDRVLKQTVTDFLKVYLDAEPARTWLIANFGTNEWPSFNVADAALVVGVITYVVYETFFLKKAAQAGPAGDSSSPAQPGA